MKIARAFGFLFLVSFGVTLLILQWESLGIQDEHVRVEIASGESVYEIAETLQGHGLIRSSFAFRLYLKSRALDRSIRSGTFLIERGMSFTDIAEMLASGEGGEVIVTIPEGLGIAQMDALLVEMGLMRGGKLIECALNCDFSSFGFLPKKSYKGASLLDGYLFPDTYYVNVADFTPEIFLERLLGTFRTKILEGLGSDIAASKRTLHEIMTMASLIERETRTAEERPIVSGILWKRFDADRGLDVDATVRYILGKTTGVLTKEDLETDSPYNTRRYRGLPPGPIANPGLASIEAALHPADSAYWYYLHDQRGIIYYAETNEEHNLNKVRYLK